MLNGKTFSHVENWFYRGKHTYFETGEAAYFVKIFNETIIF